MKILGLVLALVVGAACTITTMEVIGIVLDKCSDEDMPAWRQVAVGITTVVVCTFVAATCVDYVAGAAIGKDYHKDFGEN